MFRSVMVMMAAISVLDAHLVTASSAFLSIPQTAIVSQSKLSFESSTLFPTYIDARENWIQRNGARQTWHRSSMRVASVKHTLDASAFIAVSSMKQVDELVQTNDTSPVFVEGCVTAKRTFGSSFGFVDISVGTDEELVQLMVKRQDYQGQLGGLLHGINIGMYVGVQGVASPTRNPGEGVILVHSCEILRLPPNPQHVRTLLRLVFQEKLATSQIAAAANMTSTELNDCIQAASNESDDFDALAKKLISWPTLKERRAKVNDTYNRRPFLVAPEDLCKPPHLLVGVITSDSVSKVLSVGSVSNLYNQLDELQNSDNSLVTLEAWVQCRRRCCNSITILTVADEFGVVPEGVRGESNGALEPSRLQSVLHPDLLGEDAANVYGALLSSGSRVMLEGYIVQESTWSIPRLWVTNVRLLRCSWRPMVVRYLIELLAHDEFDVEEAASALQIDSLQAFRISQLNLTERQWKANEISQTLQDSQTRTARVSSEMMRVLASYRQLRQSYPKQQQGDEVMDLSLVAEVDNQKDQLLAINIPGTWWERKKRPQLEFMGRMIQDVVQTHPDYRKRPLRILEVGGGKGTLASYLAQLLGDDIQVQVIDIAGGAVENGMMRSKRLGFPVEFVVGDASQFESEADVVVALHACGALSDVALGHAVNCGASFVVCPCCFRSNPHLRVPLHGGGNVRVFQCPQEWLGVDTSDFEAIKRIAEIQGDAELANEAMHTLCSMRAHAVYRHSLDRNHEFDIAIKMFPATYSTRNYCLVGKVRRREYT